MNESIPSDRDQPINEFVDCHAHLVEHLSRLHELGELMSAAHRARELAAQLLTFFEATIEEHHSDEEKVLLPAIVDSAQPGEEAALVKGFVARIIQEHHEIEILWGKIKPSIKRIAKCQDSTLDASDFERLISTYKAHADFEEVTLLPLAKTILGRNSDHMAALGLSLHVKHNADHIFGVAD